MTPNVRKQKHILRKRIAAVRQIVASFLCVIMVLMGGNGQIVYAVSEIGFYDPIIRDEDEEWARSMGLDYYSDEEDEEEEASPSDTASASNGLTAPSTATPSVATPSIATPSVATPSMWSYGRSGGALDEAMDEYMREVANTNFTQDYYTDSTQAVDIDSNTSGMQYLTNDWRNYVNTIWQYRAMGEYDGQVSDKGFCWKDADEIQDEHGNPVTPWSGTLATNSDAEADPATDNFVIPRRDGEGFYEVYSGEQLLYAMTQIRWFNSPTDKSSGGIKIRLMRDLNMNGAEMNWPIISFYQSGKNFDFELAGESHTIYNLASYRYSNTSDAEDNQPIAEGNTEAVFDDIQPAGSDGYTKDMERQVGLTCGSGSQADPHMQIQTSGLSNGFIIGVCNYDITEVTFSNAKFVTSKLCDNGLNGTSLGIFGKIDGGVYNQSQKALFEDVHVKDSMFFSAKSGSNVSPFGSISQNSGAGNGANPDILEMSRCSSQGNYVYGGDHAAGFSTALNGQSDGTDLTPADIRNCFAADVLIATYGGHSGGFVSCHMENVKVTSCFSSVDMYAAAYSGGFVGLASGEFVDCFSTGKLEGFYSCGGFSASVKNSGVYGETSVQRCYSTVLVGLRKESRNMAGFHAQYPDWKDAGGGISSYTFSDCYAAGEVGDIDNDVDMKDVNGTILTAQPQANAGFLSVNTTNKGWTVQDKVADHCYYDKQTTAMRGWMASTYNERKTEPKPDSLEGLSGVMTANVIDDKGVVQTAGLTATPEEINAVTDGFRGFSEADKWEYGSSTDRRYPQLKAFSTAEESEWGDYAELVRHYSQASTGTVLLNNWGYGYNWGAYGVRTVNPQSYWDQNGEIPYKGNKYTYDTVREIVTDFDKTQGSEFEYLIKHDDGHEGAYIADASNPDEILQDDGAPAKAIIIHNDEADSGISHRGNITYAGLDWFSVNNGDAMRPIRLLPLASIEAGEMKTVYPTALYDHRTDVKLVMLKEAAENRVIGLDTDEIWSTIKMGGYPVVDPDDMQSAYKDQYWGVETDHMLTSAPISGDAIINAEIWSVRYVRMNSEALSGQNPNELSDPTYDLPYGFEWVQDDKQGTNTKRDPNIPEDTSDAVYNDIWYAYNRTTDQYLDQRGVRVTGAGTGTNSLEDEKKWNGDVPLYPDTNIARRYNIGYYWVTTDGRYIVDYKSVRIIPGTYSASIDVKHADGSYNPNALYLGVAADEVVEIEHGNLDNDHPNHINQKWTSNPAYKLSDEPEMGGTTKGHVDTDTGEYVKSDIGGYVRAGKDEHGDWIYMAYQEGMPEGTERYDRTRAVYYTDNVSMGWKKISPRVKIEKATLEFWVRNYDERVGYAVADISGGDLAEGNTFTTDINIYGLQIVEVNDGTGAMIEYEQTASQKVTLTYKVEAVKDSSGQIISYQLRINKLYNRSPEQNIDAGSTEGISPDDATIYIDDTMFNTRLTLYVNDFNIGVTKQVTGTLGDPAKGYDFYMDMDLAAGERVNYKVYDSSTGAEIEGLGGVMIGTDSNAASTKHKFKLKHNQRIQFEGVLGGTTYTIAEEDPGGYIVSANRDINGTEETADFTGHLPGDAYSWGEIEATVLNDVADKEYIFYNNKQHAPPTAVKLLIWPFAILLLLAAAGITMWMYDLRMRRIKERRMRRKHS